MFFRKKKTDSGYISPLPNILLCRAIKLHQTNEMFKNAGVWARTMFSLPVFQLGNFLTGGFPNRFFPYTLGEFLADPQRCRSISQPKNYLGTGKK